MPLKRLHFHTASTHARMQLVEISKKALEIILLVKTTQVVWRKIQCTMATSKIFNDPIHGHIEIRLFATFKT
jgi:hypothetical protein